MQTVTVTRIGLKEFPGFRITCKCGAAVELSIADTIKQNPSTCPYCKNPYRPGVQLQAESPLAKIALALEDCAKLTNATVEVVLPGTLTEEKAKKPPEETKARTMTGH